MSLARALLVAAFLAILAGPFLVRRSIEHAAVEPSDPSSDRAATLIIITPHVEQIRSEFGIAFARWHKNLYHTPVKIDWRSPGGTSEIRRQLETQLRAAIERGSQGSTFDIIDPPKLAVPDRDNPGLPELILRPGSVEADVFFGGGSYEHNAVRSGLVLNLTVNAKPQPVRCRITSVPRAADNSPCPFDQSFLENTYGENRVGIEKLYDPDQFWFGTALSGFGIVFNRDVLRRQGLPEPTSFADLGDPRYAGLLAMADPRQSGSVATLYDSILNKEGWDRGWKILREMSANARYFAASSTTPPTDVSQGDAAAGVAIDFYGRGQAQAVLMPGEDPANGRVGYIDPPGATYIDADPVSIINGARSPELARRFVEFCLTDEAQALWQFAPRFATQADSAGLDPTPIAAGVIAALLACAVAMVYRRVLRWLRPLQDRRMSRGAVLLFSISIAQFAAAQARGVDSRGTLPEFLAIWLLLLYVLMELRPTRVVLLRSFMSEFDQAVFVPVRRLLRGFGHADALRPPSTGFGEASPANLEAGHAHEAWRVAVDRLLRYAHLVIIDVSRLTPGVQWELQRLKANPRLSVVPIKCETSNIALEGAPAALVYRSSISGQSMFFMRLLLSCHRARNRRRARPSRLSKSWLKWSWWSFRNRWLDHVALACVWIIVLLPASLLLMGPGKPNRSTPPPDVVAQSNLAGPRGEPLGPQRERLRRMPVKRSMYAAYLDHFTDRTNPFDVAINVKPRGWRDALNPLMGAFAIDTSDDLHAAWIALNQARGNTAFPPDRLAEMERLFYAMPDHTLTHADGTTQTLPLNAENFKFISQDCARWRDPIKGTRAKIAYARFFSDNYRRVLQLARSSAPALPQ